MNLLEQRLLNLKKKSESIDYIIEKMKEKKNEIDKQILLQEVNLKIKKGNEYDRTR